MKAFASWQKAIAFEDPQVIIQAAAEYAASDVGNGPYVQMPSTWLNQGCWDDDRAAWSHAPAPTFQQQKVNNTIKVYQEQIERIQNEGVKRLAE